MRSSHYNDNVFINCPFDSTYKSLFDVMVFTVHDCGFIARCVLEEEDTSQVRIDKIYSINVSEIGSALLPVVRQFQVEASFGNVIELF